MPPPMRLRHFASIQSGPTPYSSSGSIRYLDKKYKMAIPDLYDAFRINPNLALAEQAHDWSVALAGMNCTILFSGEFCVAETRTR